MEHDPLVLLDHAAAQLACYARRDIDTTQRDFLTALDIPPEAWRTMMTPRAAAMGVQFTEDSARLAEQSGEPPAPPSTLVGAAVLVALCEGFMLGVAFAAQPGAPPPPLGG